MFSHAFAAFWVQRYTLFRYVVHFFLQKLMKTFSLIIHHDLYPWLAPELLQFEKTQIKFGFLLA